MIIPCIRVYECRIAGDIGLADNIAGSGSCVSPCTAAPERRFQCSCVAGRDVYSHCVIGEDSVGKDWTGKQPAPFGDVDSAAVAPSVAGDSSIRQARGTLLYEQSATQTGSLVVGNDIVDQGGIGAVQVHPAAEITCVTDDDVVEQCGIIAPMKMQPATFRPTVATKELSENKFVVWYNTLQSKQ